jgi:hypothetical protein
VKQKASSLRKSFLEITAYSLLPSFLELIDEDSAAAAAKEQQQEDDGSKRDDEEEQQEEPPVTVPAFMRMELKKLQLLARIFMGVHTAAEINTKVKLREAIEGYLIADGAVDFLRAKILPNLNL